MPSKSYKSSKSSMSSSVASSSNGKGYKWLFIGLMVILFVVFLVAFFRARTEGFESGSGSILYFFMPECGHCQKFNPEWERLQKMVDDNRAPLKLTKIDGTDDANKDLVDQYNIKGYPTIILEYGNQSAPYEGERTADAVYKWATSIAGSK